MKLFGRKNSSSTTITREKKFSFLLLFLCLLSLALLGALIYYFPPNQAYSVLSFNLSVLLLFFPLIFLFLFSLGALILRSKFHGTLIASFVTLYLLFRLNNLTHPFFLILLAALFLTLELMIANRRD